MYYSHNKFKSTYIENMIRVFAEGGSLAEYLAEIEVCKRTHYNWLDKYPNYRQAYAVALIKGEAYWQAQLQLNMANPDFNFSMARYVMSNRFGISAKGQQRAARWLDAKDPAKSLKKLMKVIKEDDMSAEDIENNINVLLKISTLKEREEIERRVAEIEDAIASGSI